MMQLEVLEYVLKQYGITNLKIDIDDFNRKSQMLVNERVRRGGIPYEGIGGYGMGAEAELIHDIVENYDNED